MDTKQLALDALEQVPATPASAVVGFDGFVDEMIKVVAERISLAEFRAVPSIATFADNLAASAGSSTLREIVVEATHPGGCAINLGDGLAHLGVPVDCFATLGEPVHPAFESVVEGFRSVHSWGREPGRTLAFEFADGKLMFSAVQQLGEFTPESVTRAAAEGAYSKACDEAGVIALTNWSLYPHMTAVWRELLQRVYSGLATPKQFFFDLVDPSGRSANDISEMLETMREFGRYGTVTLGLNGNEANVMARLRGLPETSADPDPEEVTKLAEQLRIALDLSTLVVHRKAFAVAASKAECHVAESLRCVNPMKNTGVGDRFNAGYCLGLLSGAPVGHCLSLGCATAGYFVREARSPSRDELVAFLRG